VVALFALLVGAVLVTSCSANVTQTPAYIRFDMDTQTLKWNKVPGARSYEVQISGEERVKTTSKNSFSVEYLESGKYTVQVRSINGNPDIGPSKWISYEFERAEENGLRYKLINNRSEYQITGSGTAFGDVVVKPTYRGKPVTSIADKAFYNNKKLTSLTIEGGITSIGKSAFAKCSELTSITIPDTVTELGEYAFQSCKKLTSISLPEGITELKPYTFSWCTVLSEVKLGSAVASIGEYAFSNCDALVTVTIPDSVKSIGEYAFSDCGALNAIDVGDGMENIGDYAFVNCTAATTVDLGTSLKKIGIGAFTGCALITDVALPDTTVALGAETFVNCTALKNVKLSSSLQQVGAYAFYGTELMAQAENVLCVDGWAIYCKNGDIASILKQDGTAFPEGTYGIADGAFANCDELLRVDISGVKYIGNSAFAGCSKLWDVVCDDSLLVISDGAFNSCVMLSDVYLGESLTTMGNNVFNGCRMLQDVGIDLPKSLKTMGAYCFYNAAVHTYSPNVVYVDDWVVGLKEQMYMEQINIKEGTRGIANYSFSDAMIMGVGIALPKSLRIIGAGAFYNCTYVGGFGWYDGIEYIGDYAFFGCSGAWFSRFTGNVLGVCILPRTLRYLGRSAFNGCKGMVGVEIPSGVEYIGAYCFYGCENLGDSGQIYESQEAFNNGDSPLRGDIIISDGIKYIDDKAFQGCSGVKEIILPASVTALGDRVFYKCDNLEKVVFGDGIKDIPDYTFYKCENLKEVYISDSIERIGAYAFRGCISLTELNIGASVSYIGKGAFYGCEAVREIIIPTSVKYIGEYAFRGCTGVDTLIVPSTVETVGRHAFYGLKNTTLFTDVKFEEGILPPYWNERWNSSYRPVLWGCTLSEDMSYVVSYTVSESKISNSDTPDAGFKPHRSGYTFVGWATSEGSTEVAYTAEQLLEIPEGTVLYAIWQEGEEPEPAPDQETEENEDTEGEQSEG